MRLFSRFRLSIVKKRPAVAGFFLSWPMMDKSAVGLLCLRRLLLPDQAFAQDLTGQYLVYF